MELTLIKAIVRPVLDDDNRLVSYRFLKKVGIDTIKMEECALTRLYWEAANTKRLRTLHMVKEETGEDLSDIFQVAFVDENGNAVPTTNKAADAFLDFWKTYPDFHPLGVNQHMSERGKCMGSIYPVHETLERLYGPEFANRMDLHKYLKITQIAYQPGRLWGNLGIEPVKQFVLNALIDEKRPSEDGIIFVSPGYWHEIKLAYSTSTHELSHQTTLVKINSSNALITIKGVLMKADEVLWAKMVAERAPEGVDPDDIQMILCGNAIKDLSPGGYEVGKVYEFDRSFFAYHSDSKKQRRGTVSVSKQLQTRSGWDNAHFIAHTTPDVFKTIQGLMKYDDETVLRVIGAFDKDGKESTLENDIAVRNRILYHHLPAAHPTNASQVMRRALSYIRDHLSKVEVPGFQGMGAPSPIDERGAVLVPEKTYQRWMQRFGTNEAYLFRMPYLGSYCGMYVTLRPYATDTIHIHWEDALQMEGDFDGDKYYVIPSHLVKDPEVGIKPARPPKQAKDVVPLNAENLLTAIVDMAENKQGIGPCDNMLSMAYDWYHQAVYEQDEHAIKEWREKIAVLQIYTQQAIEGLKHSAEGRLTEDDIDAMFPNGLDPHPYTSLFAKAKFDSARMSMQTFKDKPGYIDLCRSAFKGQHRWHPLHTIFEQLAQLEFGQVEDVLKYWEAVKAQETYAIAKISISPLYAKLRRLHQLYAANVARWNGGKNKNMSFGKDVLGPIREIWTKILALTDGKPNAQALKRDLHLMLANVGYEPQPNWQMVGVDERYGLGVFTRMRRYRSQMTLRTEGIRSIEFKSDDDARRMPTDGIVRKPVNGKVFSVRLWLPRPGSLFHHLTTPEFARDILKAALPTTNFDQILADALRSEFGGDTQSLVA